MAEKLTNPFIAKLLKNEVARFFLSAGVGFVVDAFVYYVIYNDIFHHNRYEFYTGYIISGDVVSLIISYTCNIICNFLLTRYFVFSHSTLSPRKQFLRFASVAFIGFFANLLVLKILVFFFKLYPPLARIIAALSLGIASYFVHKFFSFNLKRSPK